MGVQGHNLLIVQLTLALADDLIGVVLAPVGPVLGGVAVHGDDPVDGPAGPDQLAVVAAGHHRPFQRPRDLHLPAQTVHHHLGGGLMAVGIEILSLSVLCALLGLVVVPGGAAGKQAEAENKC